MSYLDWHVGMKVVCIDGSMREPAPSFDDPDFLTAYPIEGGIYTIRKIDARDGRVVVLLDEVRNNPRIIWADGFIGEAAFVAERFRPVQTRKTDISIFTSMLNGAEEREWA